VVFAIMLVIAGYRVYQIFNPPPPPQEKPLVRPKPYPPENAGPGIIPPEPGSRPPIDLPGDFSGLYNANPFWYYSTPERSNTKIPDAAPPINVLAIREVGGRLRAQLSTEGVPKKWYNEGDKIQDFELQNIDNENKTVTVYSERANKRFTLSAQAE
jgi:hypothetical protein